MTLAEMHKSTLSDVAHWFVKLGACPMETGEESICVVDEYGDRDCKTCWEMHLVGEDRENIIDDAKEYGRGYCA